MFRPTCGDSSLCAFIFRTQGCGCAKHPAFPAPSPRKRSRLSRPRGAMLEAKTRAESAAGTKTCDNQPGNCPTRIVGRRDVRVSAIALIEPPRIQLQKG